MFSIINKYLFKTISNGVLLAMLMFLTLSVLLGFIQQINAVGKGDFTMSSAVFYTALTIPSIVYDYFPISSVVGVMIGLGVMAANSELVVIQSAGMSRLKIAWITIVTLLIWLVPITLMGEFVVPPAKMIAENYRSSKITKDVGLGLKSGVWIRDGNIIFNAKATGNVYDVRNKNIVINDVTVFVLDDKLRVEKISKAQKAVFKGDHWQLTTIEVTQFLENGVKTQKLKSQQWPSRIEPDLLSITNARPKYLSIRDIIKYKNFQSNKQHIPAKYTINLWAKFAFPILVIATALAGLPFLFGLLRAGGFGQRLLIGIMLGLVYYVINRSLLNIGEIFNVHPSVVTILPSAGVIMVLLLYLRIKN